MTDASTEVIYYNVTLEGDELEYEKTDVEPDSLSDKYLCPECWKKLPIKDTDELKKFLKTL